MDYEKSLHDDQEVTVGDLRILDQGLQVVFCLTAALVYWLAAVVTTLSGSLVGFLSTSAFSVFFMGFAWATFKEGKIRRLYGLFHDFETEPLSDAEFGQNSKSATPRGDD